MKILILLAPLLLAQDNALQSLRAQEKARRPMGDRSYFMPVSLLDWQDILRGRPPAPDQETADLLLRLGKYDAAKAAYNKLLPKADPRTRLELLNGLGAAQTLTAGLDLEAHARAKETFRNAAAATHPDKELNALSYLGLCHATWKAWAADGSKGKPDASACGKASGLSPRAAIAAEVQETLAETAFAAGQKGAGVSHIRRAISLLKAAKAAKASELQRLQSRIDRKQ